ncbi:MAG: hypothetical protein Q8R15_01330 [Candidatus Micrarchaeota archaeon]|nr:hypothetical protein [Candidatus Micrarchaeota archaeon]
MAEQQSIVKDLAHVVVLLILILVLLVVVTKFKVVHPSAIPGWQGVYCTYVEQKHSVVGFVYGDDGAGDPEQLVETLSKNRPSLRTELVQMRDVSPGLLSRYEVIVLEKSKTVPFRALSALEGYLDNGGSLVWTSDSLSKQVLDDRDLEEARQYNVSHPEWREQSGTGKDYYTWFLDTYQAPKGFAEFGDKFLGAFLKTQSATSSSAMMSVMRDHLIISGIQTVAIPSGTTLGVVNQNDDVNMIASVEYGKETFPAILEKKYVGRILYLAFPLEALNSKTFIDNIFDYLVTC